MTVDLGTFDGRDVLGTTIAVTGAGDGLSQALRLDPTVLHIGEKVFVVLEAEVVKVRHEGIKDTEALTRVHMVRAGTAALVDESEISEMLERQRERLRLAQEKKDGIQRLDIEQANLRGDHVLGQHDGDPISDCELCQQQHDAAADSHVEDFEDEEELEDATE